jgi:hypothetical protein
VRLKPCPPDANLVAIRIGLDCVASKLRDLGNDRGYRVANGTAEILRFALDARSFERASRSMIPDCASPAAAGAAAAEAAAAETTESAATAASSSATAPAAAAESTSAPATAADAATY